MEVQEQKGSLLIVDDEIFIMSKLEELCLDYTDHIYTAFNGFEALKILEQQSVDCIICDLNMPKFDGMDVLKEIRSRGLNIPFIFYTSYGDIETVTISKELEAFAFITKPNISDLLFHLQNGLRYGRELKEGIGELRGRMEFPLPFSNREEGVETAISEFSKSDFA